MPFAVVSEVGRRLSVAVGIVVRSVSVGKAVGSGMVEFDCGTSVGSIVVISVGIEVNSVALETGMSVGVPEVVVPGGGSEMTVSSVIVSEGNTEVGETSGVVVSVGNTED